MILPQEIPSWLGTDAPQPGVYRVSDSDYHGGPGHSSTRLKRAAKSPAHAMVPQEDSEPLAFGRALHCALLEPSRFNAAYRVWRGGRRQGKGWEAFKAEGGEILTEADFDTIVAIMARAENSEIWQGLKDGAELEVAAYAIDPMTRQLCKAKADVFTDSDLIFDWKTTTSADPDSFERAIREYGYHISAAFYLDVFTWATGERPRGFLWGAAEKKAPFGIRYFQATPAMLEVGRAEYQKALAALSGCEKTGVYPCYPDEILPIEMSPFYLRRFGL